MDDGQTPENAYIKGTPCESVGSGELKSHLFYRVPGMSYYIGETNYMRKI